MAKGAEGGQDGGDLVAALFGFAAEDGDEALVVGEVFFGCEGRSKRGPHLRSREANPLCGVGEALD